MKLIRCFLLLVLMGFAALGMAVPFRPGFYRLTEGMTTLWSLTFYKSSPQATVYRVKGTIAGAAEALDMEIEGTYDPVANKLKAKTLGISGFKILDVDGSWDAQKSRFNVNTEGAPAVQLHYVGAASLATTGTIDINVTKAQAGRPIEGTVTIKLRNVLEPYMGEIFATFASSSSMIQKKLVRIEKDTDITLSFRKDLPLTAPGGLATDLLRVGVRNRAENWYSEVPYSQVHITIEEGLHDKASIQEVSYSGINSTAPAKEPFNIIMTYSANAASTQTEAQVNHAVRWKIIVKPEDGVVPTQLFQDGTIGTKLPGEFHLPVSHTLRIPALNEGRYRLIFEGSGPTIDPYTAEFPFVVAGKGTQDPFQNRKEIKPGVLSGSASVNKATAKVGEVVKLTINYTMSDGEDYTSVFEEVKLVGPKGGVEATSNEERFIDSGGKKQRVFDIKPGAPGTFKIDVKVKGQTTNEWKTSTSFTVSKATTTTPPVKKPEPTADFTGEWEGEGGHMVLTQSGTSVKGKYKWMDGTLEGTVTGRVLKFKWSQPRNDRYGTGEFTMSSGGNSFSGTHVYTHPPEAVSIPPKPWGGTRTPGTKGPANQPQTYPPQAYPPEDFGKASSMTATGPADDEERFQIKARIEPSSITLRAGEPSQIVNIIISGFRTRTEDRVEVVFPQATDGWASLPNQIVVGAGNGSYWPPNMDRPEHTDGYFFSARQTAPGGTTTIRIIVRQRGAGQIEIPLTVTVIPKSGRVPNPNNPNKPTNPPKNDPGKTDYTSVAGSWNSPGHPWKQLVIQLDGNKFSATFADGKGKMTGTVSGKKVTFDIVDEEGTKGKGTLEMSDDGKGIEGSYRLEGDEITWFFQFSRK